MMTSMVDYDIAALRRTMQTYYRVTKPETRNQNPDHLQIRTLNDLRHSSLQTNLFC